MKLLIEHGTEIMLCALIGILCFLGAGTLSYKTQSNTYQTSVIENINDTLGLQVKP